MRTRISNSGKGWFITAKNNKDPNDKTYLGVHFSKCEEPIFEPNDKGYQLMDIMVKEGLYSCYKGKAGLVVFDYDIVPMKTYQDTLTGDGRDMLGFRDKDVKVDTEDLPFY